MTNEITTTKSNSIGMFENLTDMTCFDNAQRMAKALMSSPIVPKEYSGNIGSTLIAIEMATRLHVSPLTVMQNLHIIHGRPSWSSQFIISAINACGRFEPLRYDKTETSCRAWTIDKTGERLEGPMVTLEMAKAEGWSTKNGSKWKTMPELMLMYRSASMFGRLYAPDVLMGMYDEHEQRDIGPAAGEKEVNTNDLSMEIMAEDEPQIEEIKEVKEEVVDIFEGELMAKNDKQEVI